MIEPMTETDKTAADVIRAFAAVATGVQGLAMGQSPPIPVLTCKQSNSQILVDILDIILATGGPHAKAINHQV